MKRFGLILLVLLFAVIFGCTEKEGPVNPDPRFADSFDGKEYTLNYDLSNYFIADTVNFAFKDIKTQKILEYSALVSYPEAGSRIKLSDEIPDGKYLLLYADYFKNPRKRSSLFRKGMGLTIEFSNEKASVRGKNKFDDDTDDPSEGNDPEFLSGHGTKESPYIVTSGEHLWKIQERTNHDNYEVFKGVYFRQECDVDLYGFGDFATGWVPISYYTDFPFKGLYDGKGCSISGLEIFNEKGNMTALFGCTEGAVIKNLTIKDPVITGGACTAPLIGSVFTAGDTSMTTIVKGVRVINPIITGTSAVSGLVASVDQFSALYVDSVKVSGANINGGYGVGGLVGVGSVYSRMFIDSVSFDGNLSSIEITGDPISFFGGVVGTCDTIAVSRAFVGGDIVVDDTNTSDYDNVGLGIGGVIGGCGMSQIMASKSTMKITTHNESRGVGGILGTNSGGKSERGDDEIFNNATLIGVCNEGSISGGEDIGGIMGEGQAYMMYCYNTGNITSQRNAGGIVAKSPQLILHGITNTGEIIGGANVGGIAGLSNFNQLFLCNNYGKVTAQNTETNLGGILGTAGNNSALSFSGNYGLLTNKQARKDDYGSLGGIVGRLGDPREYSLVDQLSIAFGCISIVGSVIDFGLGFKTKALGPNATHGYTVGVGVYDGFMQAMAVGTFIGFTTYTYTSGPFFDVEIFEAALKQEVENISKEISYTNEENAEKFKSGLQEGKYPIELNEVKKFVDSQDSLQHSFFETLFNDDMRQSESLVAAAHNGINDQKEVNRAEVIHTKDVNNFVTTLVGLITTTASLFLTIGAACVTGGAALICTVISSLCGIASGASSIVSGVYDFTENVSIVAQCYNFGDIDPDSNIYTGGVAGELGDFATIDNCYVIGNLLNDIGANAGGIVGATADEIQVTGSVLYTKSWPHQQFGNTAGSTVPQVFESFYVSDESSSWGKTVEELKKQETYLSLGLDWDYWTIPEEEGLFPLFYNSKYLTK